MRTTSRLLAISSLGLTSIVLMLAGMAVARTRPHYGGVVRIEAATSTKASTFGLVRTLTSVDAPGRVQPLLAERWESQNGGRRWQFWLRANVRFHDGKRAVGSDVAEALSTVPGAPWRTVRASGTTVTFEADDPCRATGDPGVAPLRGRQARFVGDTPLVPALSVRPALPEIPGKLAAFDDYWQGRPYVDSAEFVTGRSVAISGWTWASRVRILSRFPPNRFAEHNRSGCEHWSRAIWN